jgi:hypothetical protein
MNFNNHFELAGRHSFLSASSSHWLRYDDEKIVSVFRNRQAALRGTELHELASNLIRLRVKLPKTGQTLNMYVNDAIGLHMVPEQILFFSPNAFGTTDAIWIGKNVHVDPSRDLLRIHDLKTGEGKTSFDQLKVYAAFYCLEYLRKPHDLDMEFRIYQNDERKIEEGDPDEIQEIMDKLRYFDALLDEVRLEG